MLSCIVTRALTHSPWCDSVTEVVIINIVNTQLTIASWHIQLILFRSFLFPQPSYADTSSNAACDWWTTNEQRASVDLRPAALNTKTLKWASERSEITALICDQTLAVIYRPTSRCTHCLAPQSVPAGAPLGAICGGAARWMTGSG